MVLMFLNRCMPQYVHGNMYTYKVHIHMHIAYTHFIYTCMSKHTTYQPPANSFAYACSCKLQTQQKHQLNWSNECTHSKEIASIISYIHCLGWRSNLQDLPWLCSHHRSSNGIQPATVADQQLFLHLSHLRSSGSGACGGPIPWQPRQLPWSIGLNPEPSN